MKRRKERRWIWAVLLALLAAQLTGCGSSGGSSNGRSAMQSAPADVNFDSIADAPMEAPMGVEGEYGWSDEAVGSGSIQPSQNKIILTASLRMETREFEKAVKALDQAVEDEGGWYETRQLEEGGRYRNLSGAVRVPVEHFEELLDRAGEIAHVTSRHENQDDVSEAYYDNETRLTTQRTKMERLQALLAQAENMEDIIALESAISDTELQIEYLTGSLRHYDSQINYSTVTVDLQEVYRLSEDEVQPLTFGQRVGGALGTGWQRGLEFLENVVIFLAQSWFFLLLLAAAAAIAVPLFRRHRRKWQEKKLAAGEAQDAAKTASPKDSGKTDQ